MPTDWLSKSDAHCEKRMPVLVNFLTERSAGVYFCDARATELDKSRRIVAIRQAQLYQVIRVLIASAAGESGQLGSGAAV